MAAIASPTPLPFHMAVGDHRSSLRQLSSRATVARSFQSRVSPVARDPRSSYPRPTPSDSSDDEDLAPIKLSAEAQAILGEDNAIPEKDVPVSYMTGGKDHVQALIKPQRKLWSAAQSSMMSQGGSPAPRVVRIDGKRPSPRATLARDGSFMYKIHEKTSTGAEMAQSETPAPSIRRIRVSGSRSQTRTSPSASSNSRSDNSSARAGHIESKSQEEPRRSTPEEDVVTNGPSTVSRPRRGEEHGVHSTMRVRRIGTGALLNGPVRRGMIRRQSAEDNEHTDYKPEPSASPEIQQGRKSQQADLLDNPDDVLHPYQDLREKDKSQSDEYNHHAATGKASSPSPPPQKSVSEDSGSPVQHNMLARSTTTSRPTPSTNKAQSSTRTSSSNRNPIFKIASLPLLESAHDQENEPPPTFKRSKPSVALLELQEEQRMQDRGSDMQPAITQQHQAQSENQKSFAPADAAASPVRAPLAARSSNTPHRPAPAPPPKMSLIEAATSSAGNSRGKKPVHYSVNGRIYRRLDCIGRGGSSRVFRIMAENYKIFALKRVNLEEADMAAIAGYKGEIDLLQKLSNVDRVIRLFDYEVNEEKGVLSVMMELGESDFNKMLNEQLKGENARLDITFTRHYWKEMLECVQAVHTHDIVHSDLKPANFLLVKGQLKLIDFGIANAIQDNTVNVHRENQIGTPNYMSPESLVAHTTTTSTTGSIHGGSGITKILKLGKPSDVWSLGCILYQMTYGQPPFAHITKQFERIMSIPNPKVEIKFPTTGIGGAVVPFGLIKTLSRCLERDQTLRPTIKELLSDSDPFLHPVAISPDMLGRVIGNVMGYCRKREEALRQEGTLGQPGVSCVPRDEEMRGWPLAFYEKLRQAQEEGTDR